MKIPVLVLVLLLSASCVFGQSVSVTFPTSVSTPTTDYTMKSVSTETLKNAASNVIYWEYGSGDTRSVFFGPNSGGVNQTASSLNNLAGGNSSLHALTTGIRNTGWGNKTLYLTTTGSYNTALGYTSLWENITGSYNTGSGANAIFRTRNDGNSGFGTAAGYYTTTGGANTFLGHSAGSSNVVGSGNVFAGASANYIVPGAATQASATSGSGVDIGIHAYKVIFKFGSRRSTASTETANLSVTSGNQQVQLSSIPVYGGALAGVVREIYRSKAADYQSSYDGARSYYLLTTLNDNTTTTYTDTQLDSGLGSAESGNDGGIALGSEARLMFGNTAVIGSSNYPIKEIYLGAGFEGSTPPDVLIQPTLANGSNVNGANLTIGAGAGTGSGCGGSLTITTNISGTSGLVTNDKADVIKVTCDKITHIYGLLAQTPRMVADLPSTPIEGMIVSITDSNVNTWGATISGGGTNHVLAYYNGTNWTVTGK